ncbi:MAG: hypothetical protein Q4D14_06045 [Bacteroidales bacterium]|nr:hypothetical protein [Bacteroidales bacterium]
MHLIRRQIIYVCTTIILLWVVAIVACAQTTHYLYANAGFGYTALPYRTADYHSVGNVGGVAGVGYELQTNGGFVFSLGATFDAVNNTSRHNDFTDSRLMIDTDGLEDGTPWYDTVMFNTAYSRFRETQSVLLVGATALFGARFNRFTILVGGKASFPLLTNFSSKARITTTGDYQWFSEEFHDMENHYYVSNYALKSKGSLTTSLNIDAVLQAYFDCTPSRWKSTQLHLGVYVSYGVLNINKESTDRALIVRHENPLDITFNSQLQTAAMNSKHVAPLAVGLSAKFLFELGTSSGGGRVHRHCNCINGFNHSRWSRF